MSVSFDTLDHSILIRKMEHYGISDQELDLFRSYFQDRYQYVELESKKSEVIKCLPSSVVQGSKLSGMLYMLYINESTELQNLLDDKE